MASGFPIIRTGIGQSGRRFLPEDSSKPCMIGGVIFEDVPGLDAESDGDVLFHALCNAIASLTGAPILSEIAEELCRKDGITDSGVYLEKALDTLGGQNILHIAFTVEGTRPRLQEKIPEIIAKVSSLCGLRTNQVGLSVTSCDGLTDFSCGEGLQCFCIVTTEETYLQ